MKRIGWVAGISSLLLISAFAVHAQTGTPSEVPAGSLDGNGGGVAAGGGNLNQGLLLTLMQALIGNTSVPTSQLNARCVGSIDVPGNVWAGEEFRAKIRVENTGATIWRRSENFKLGSPNLQYNTTTWGVGGVNLPSSTTLHKRDETFRFDASAPAAPGIYPFSWQMLQGNQLFGAVCTRNIEVKLHPNDADSISITGIPNRVETGQQFTARITMRNNSRRTWTVGEYRLGSNGLVASNTTVEGSLRAFLSTPVPPNGRVVFDLPVTAPATVAGNFQTLTLRWKMLQENFEWFGQAGSRSIRVYRGTNPTVTVTPTPTPTPVITPFLQFACLPRQQTAVVGQPVTVFEDPFEGNFSANWLASGGVPTAGTGTSFTTTFDTVGDKTITARSVNFPGGEKTDACRVTVTTGTVTPSPIITPVVTPTPTPTETPTSTYVPNPYDGQTITPPPINSYDSPTITPNAYTNQASLTASLTVPANGEQFTQGQSIELVASGNGTPVCGTWTLTKQNGQVITLGPTDFASGQLPENLPLCNPSSAY